MIHLKSHMFNLSDIDINILRSFDPSYHCYTVLTEAILIIFKSSVYVSENHLVTSSRENLLDYISKQVTLV